MSTDEPSDFELLSKFITARVHQFGLAIATSQSAAALRVARSALFNVAVRADQRIATVAIDRERPLHAQLVEAARGVDVLFVEGLETLLLDRYGGPTFSPAIEQLNWDRDRLALAVTARVVLWLVESAALALAAAARDLNDVVLARYHFDEDTNQRVILRPLTNQIAAVASQLGMTESALREHVLDKMLSERPEGSGAWAAAAHDRARLARRAGNDGLAQTLYEGAIRVYERLKDARRAASSWAGLAAVKQAQGQLAEAITLLEGHALPCARSAGDKRGLALVQGQLARLLEEAGRADEAAQLVERELIPAVIEIDDRGLRAMAFRDLARHQRARGETAESVRLLRDDVIPAFRDTGDVSAELESLQLLADVMAKRGDLTLALGVLRDEMLPLTTTVGRLEDEASVLAMIADVLAAQGNVEQALAILRDEVRPLAERSAIPHFVTAVDDVIQRLVAMQRRVDDPLAQ